MEHETIESLEDLEEIFNDEENIFEDEILDVSENIQDELQDFEAVDDLVYSDSDVVSVLYEIRDLLADSNNTEEFVEVSILDKPLEDYTTSESLCLLIFILLLWLVISRAIGGVFK